MNIFLTGGTGFVGRHLTKRLQELGHNVHLFKRGDPLISDLIDHDFPRPDCVINAAGEINQPHKMFEANVIFTEKLLRFARDSAIPKVIHVGSSSEYGKINAPRHENTACFPTNLYDGTKIAATALCQGFAHQYDMDISIARPFSLYGAFDTPRKLIPRLLQSYFSHERITIREGSHDWTYITDYCDGIITLMNASRELTKGDIVNFGTEICSSNQEVVESLELALGGKLNVVYEEGRYHTYDTDKWVADTAKAYKKYGWTHKYSLLKGMKELVMQEWFAKDSGGNGE